MRGLLSTRDIRTANTPLGLLGIAPPPVNRNTVAPVAPQAAPERRRAGFLSFLLGGTEGRQAEQDRLDSEPLREASRARMLRLQSYVDTLDPSLQLAYEANREALGEAFASRGEAVTLDQGDVRMVGDRVVYGAPFEAAPGSTIFDPTRPGQPIARAPSEAKVAGGALVAPDGTVLYRGPQVEGVAATADAFYTPEIAGGQGGGAPRIARAARPDTVTVADGAEVYDPTTGALVARNAPNAGNRKSYEDSIGVRRYEDTGEPVFPDDFARIRGQAESRLTAAEQAADNLEAEIRKALDLSGGGETGVVGAVMGAVPGTRARQLRNVIETIKSNIGFNYLQQMRELSPTGGALGNVALQELQALQSVFGNLDPNMSEDQLDGVLRQILGIVGQGRALRQQAFQSQYGAAPSVRGGQAQGQQARPRARNPQTGEVIEWNGSAWVPAR